MDHEKFDQALIQAAMAQAEEKGWPRTSIVSAARSAGLPLDEARARFPMRSTVLLRLGMLADRAALVEDGSAGTVREQLFDLVMRRIDVLQQYRGGVCAVLRALPLDPGLSLALGLATQDSLRWIAEAAGVETAGLSGAVRVQGVVAVWLATVHAWRKDDSVDLSATMAALDKALDRAEWAGRMLERPLFDRGAASLAEPSDGHEPFDPIPPERLA